MIPSVVPFYNYSRQRLFDGACISACQTCKKAMCETACKEYYNSLISKPFGYYQCPKGFTTRTLGYAGGQYALTGVIAWPRFNTDKERTVAKLNPEVKIKRETLDAMVKYLNEIEVLRASEIQLAASVLPQALHELRKLNGTVIQYAEKMLKSNHSSDLISIKGAADLMKNNFDILEALANVEGIHGLPNDTTINLYDITYKTKKILEARANIASKSMIIQTSGVRAIIFGSQKSFPIVPATIVENAIKYGISGTVVNIRIFAENGRAVFECKNETDHPIDPIECFNKGTRFAPTAAEGGGFGLFLAKEVIKAHKGAIICTKEGKNVLFRADFPLKEVIDFRG